MIYPTSLELSPENRLLITWSDGQKRSYTVRELREACPCATCREKRNQPVDPFALPVLKEVRTQPLTIAGMEPMGNYAYGIRFSDDHDTGIFAFSLLRELGQAVS
ncbi:MAG TPA: DUF971 domain-containing protein [Pirellulaceae bacterium]